MFKWLREKVRDMLTIKMICRECKHDVAIEEHSDQCLTGLLKKALVQSRMAGIRKAAEANEQKA